MNLAILFLSTYSNIVIVQVEIPPVKYIDEKNNTFTHSYI